MDESERRELARLREEQARLEIELRRLSEQLRGFEARLSAPPSPAAPPIASPPPLIRTVEPIIPNLSAAKQPEPKLPPALPTSAAIASQQTRATEFSGPASTMQSRPAPEPVLVPEPPKMAGTNAGGERSLEMRVGTYWLVRVGIVMVLTGLVLFGNLAYQKYISKLGPAGKVTLLYLASGGLLAAGWWWQRRAVKEALRNYAQVLFAGGLASLYFTTYAAHHLEPLRIIESALLDGVLLLGCAGLMVWAAERKKSEVLAFFAVGLAYYTSIITRVGQFTLWSNLVLCAAGVFFLVRNRWAALSFGSLVATYASYAFWRFFNGSEWHWASPDAGLWSGTWFLMCYWAVFTSAVFLSRHEKFAGPNRASFLTGNNAAFFGIFLLTMLQVRHGGFWKFSLGYGAVLLGLAQVVRRVLPTDRLSSNAYLTQGLLLVTVGFIAKFAGMQLALVLGTESVLLLMLGQQRASQVLRVGAFVCAGLSIAWAMDGLKPFDSPSLWLAIGLGILMMANALLLEREWHKRPVSTAGPALRPQPAYFTALAMLIWSLATWHNTSKELFPILLGAEGLVLTVSVYLLRVREIPLLAQGVVAFALGTWLLVWFTRHEQLPWWNPAILLVILLSLSHWWQRQTVVSAQASINRFGAAAYALGLNLVLYLWVAPQEPGAAWILITSGMAVGLTLYGVTTRAWFVAAFGQMFLAVSVIQFVVQMLRHPPQAVFALGPILGLGLLSFGTVQWFRGSNRENNAREPLLEAALAYRWAALALSIAWVCEYVSARERIWVLSAIGLVLFLWSGRSGTKEGLLFSAVYSSSAAVLFWLPLLETPAIYLPDLLAIVIWLSQGYLARRRTDRYRLDPGVPNAVAVVGSLSLWLFVSRWVMELAGGFYLTASWSLLALILLSAGLLLRERMYRWIGLGILACALGRVVLFDVWKLETIYRILSLMALGIVLLVLGFIYSKYQEKIKEWL